MKNILLTILLLIPTACSTTQSVFNASIFSTTPEAQNIRLFLSRAHMTGTDYEHYQLSDNTLLFECGTILNNRFRVQESQEVLIDNTLSSTLLNEADIISSQYLGDISIKEELPKPGTNKHLADPGKLELKIWNSESETQIKTSLDGASKGRKNFIKAIRELGRDLRKSTGKESLCQNASFYGFHDSKEKS